MSVWESTVLSRTICRRLMAVLLEASRRGTELRLRGEIARSRLLEALMCSELVVSIGIAQSRLLKASRWNSELRLDVFIARNHAKLLSCLESRLCALIDYEDVNIDFN